MKQLGLLTLHLRHCGLTTDVVAGFAGMPVTSLTVMEEILAPGVLSGLAILGLTHLTLEECEINNDIVFEFATLSELVELDLGECTFADGARITLCDQFPDAEMVNG